MSTVNVFDQKFSIDEEQKNLIEEFSFFDDWTERYEYLIDLGRKLPEFPSEYQVDEFKLKGCQSQVWLVPSSNPNGTLHFELDSDAHIVRGLIGIVLAAYNDKAPADILAFDIEGLFSDLALLEHLSQSRGNGLRAMIQRVRTFAEAC